MQRLHKHWRVVIQILKVDYYFMRLLYCLLHHQWNCQLIKGLGFHMFLFINHTTVLTDKCI